MTKRKVYILGVPLMGENVFKEMEIKLANDGFLVYNPYAYKTIKGIYPTPEITKGFIIESDCIFPLSGWRAFDDAREQMRFAIKHGKGILSGGFYE